MLFRLRRSGPIVVGLLFLLSACAGNAPQPPAVEGFRCHAAVTCPDLAVEGTLTRQNAGLLTFEISAPPSLRDVTLVWDGETVSVRLHGLTFGIDPAQLPASGVGTALLAALDAAIGSDGAETAEGLSVVGQSSSGRFTLLSDPETGHLLSLSLPELGITADFSDFERLAGGTS